MVIWVYVWWLCLLGLCICISLCCMYIVYCVEILIDVYLVKDVLECVEIFVFVIGEYFIGGVG